VADILLDIQELTKSYTNGGTETKVLHGIDFQVDRGSFSAIIGPSGSGKSTLLNLLGALDRPTGGRIIVDGSDIVTMNDRELAAFRNRKIGFVFQFHHLLPEFTALENVMMPYWIASGKPAAKTRKKAEELVDLVGLGERGHFKASRLSGGQQQRIAIARSLMNDPSLVLADEPTGNLDSETTEQIFALMERIRSERQATFLIITHDRHIAARSERVVELIDGRVARIVANPAAAQEDSWLDLAPSHCLLAQQKPAASQ